MRVLRFELSRADVPYIALGAGMTCLFAFATTRVGETFSLGVIGVLLLLFALIAGFVAAPHLMIAGTIPLFALLPTLKVFAADWLGPLKDLVSLAAIAAALVLVIKRSSAGTPHRGDFWVGTLVVFLLSLYALNIGAGLARDLGWFHGIRLMGQPLLLLLVGLLLPHARRTLRWAIVSLLATASVVALYGVMQQAIGADRLHSLGYEWDVQLRFFQDRIRSFGTMDEPFAYAAFLLLALATVMLSGRRGFFPLAVGVIVIAGLSFSFVRSAVIVSIGLLGLWFARQKRPTISLFLMTFAVSGAIAILAVSSDATQSRTVRAGPSFFLTVNGRTEGWAIYLNDPKVWAVGHGVGKVGTAAERARYDISQTREDIEERGYAVDSGYLAVIADVGLVGLAVFLALVLRIIMLAKRSIRRGSDAGWLALAFVSVLMLDAVTRASFTGFPTAFLGFLLVGLALGAANEEAETAARPEQEALLTAR
jgi:hypothetical protein